MKASAFIATSLEGYIARPDGALDWLPQDGGEPHGYEEFMATVDGLVIGRKTFETVMGFDAWPYGKKPVVVLSSTLKDLEVPEGAVCEVMSGTPRTIAARLEKRGLKHLYVDGGVTVTRFLGAGVLQRLVITRIPVLLGKGIPLFGHFSRDIRLEHVATHGRTRVAWCRASTWSARRRARPRHEASAALLGLPPTSPRPRRCGFGWTRALPGRYPAGVAAAEGGALPRNV